jgi:hypothetical protein
LSSQKGKGKDTRLEEVVAVGDELNTLPLYTYVNFDDQGDYIPPPQGVKLTDENLYLPSQPHSPRAPRIALRISITLATPGQIVPLKTQSTYLRSAASTSIPGQLEVSLPY